MFPYSYRVNPIFTPGVESLGFEDGIGKPGFAVQGPGNFCGQLRIFTKPAYQSQAIPAGWLGQVTGQLVLQPLTRADGLPQT